MRTLPNSPSSVWQCIKLCFVMSPQVVRTNWLNYALVVVISFISQYAATHANVWGGLIYLLMTFAAWFAYSALFYKAYQFAKGNIVSDHETYSVVKQRYLRVVGVYLLFYFGSIAVLAIPAVLIIYLITSVNQSYALLFIPLGLAFFCVALNFFYIMPAVVEDNMKIIQAYKYSFNLVKGHWWRNLGVMIGYMGIATFFIGIISGLFSGIVYRISAVDYSSISLSIILSLLIPLLVTAFLVVEYNDLKQRLAVKK